MSDHAERECEALFGSPYDRIAELERELVAACKERDALAAAGVAIQEYFATTPAIIGDRYFQDRERERKRKRDTALLALQDSGAILAAHDSAKNAEIAYWKSIADIFSIEKYGRPCDPKETTNAKTPDIS